MSVLFLTKNEETKDDADGQPESRVTFLQGFRSDSSRIYYPFQAEGVRISGVTILVYLE